MKAFEKWLKEEAPKVMPIATEDREQITPEEAAEKGYRGALEWVIKQECEINNLYELLKVIEEELEEETITCDNCGAKVIRCGTCIKCLNCGNSIGCS